MQLRPTFVDFFAGIGLFRLGMERAGWSALLELDWDERKQRMYEGHFGPGTYERVDIREVAASAIPEASLYHASFPCTDLSLAGGRAGLEGEQSSSFWAFVDVLRAKGANKPRIVTLENVTGFVSSRNGRDFADAMGALSDLGYAVDVLVLDAAWFVPQSRQRLFVVAALADGLDDGAFETERVLSEPSPYRPVSLLQAVRANPQVRWRLRMLPPLAPRADRLDDIVDGDDEDWWPRERTDYLVSQMSERHLGDLREMVSRGTYSYGTVFRRMRTRDGVRQSTAELRTDGLAGCLRTPKGGSARQILVRAGNGTVDARLLNGTECARLMGAGEFTIDASLSETDVLFGFGDAVCADAVTWLARHVIEPLAEPVATAVFEP